MKKGALMLFYLLTTVTVFAQEIVSTQGDSYSNADYNIDFTVGEVVINTVTNGATVLTQGFHQSKWNFLGLEDHSPDYEAVVYPNPMDDVLNIKVSDYQDVAYVLYDINGKIISENRLNSNSVSIIVDYLPPGSYNLVLIRFSEQLKTFKLVKHTK